MYHESTADPDLTKSLTSYQLANYKIMHSTRSCDRIRGHDQQQAAPAEECVVAVEANKCAATMRDRGLHTAHTLKNATLVEGLKTPSR